MSGKNRALRFFMSLVLALSTITTGILPVSAAGSTFTDVPSDAYFAGAVGWAVDKEITKGTSATTFSPGKGCTRGQCVTFLYRYAGSPKVGEGKASKFTDVKSGEYYADAVAWAVENGVTSGTSDTTFSPNKDCTRAQIVTFLWRYKNQPKVNNDGSFKDVKSDAYFAGAVSWAVEQDITKGTSDTTFSPNQTCTRAQIVTFLYRMDQASEQTFTVSFESNGGSKVKEQKIKANEKVSRPEDPKREGYLFSGWYSDPKLTIEYDFSSKVTDNTTLYAKWIIDDASSDDYLVALALSELIVDYQGADNADSVTSDLILPTSVEDVEGVTIAWTSSNNTIISNDGKVTRPNKGKDAEVTLRVKVSKGKASDSKTFTINVIHQKDRADYDVPTYSEQDIKNDSSHPEIIYNEDNSQVICIDGDIVDDVKIENVDDAQDALQSVREVIGLSDVYKELESQFVIIDEYSDNYSFQQIWNGVRVDNYGVTICADKSGQSNYLNSGLLKESLLQTVDTKPAINQLDAEKKAKEVMGSENVLNEKTELLIYASGDYTKSPILVYSVYSEDGGQNAYIDAKSGELVDVFSCEWTATGSGYDELQEKERKDHPDTIIKPVEFPIAKAVTAELFPNECYYMLDLDRNIVVYLNSTVLGPCRSKTTFFDDATAVSAYTNVIKAYDWYKNTFGFLSYDNKGSVIPVVVHDFGDKNNAAWKDGLTLSYYDNKNDVLNKDITMASCDDVAAHELGHAVTASRSNLGGHSGERNYLSAISEAYSDIFACLSTGDWVFQEQWDNGSNKRIIYDPLECSYGSIQAYNHPNAYRGVLFVDPYTVPKNYMVDGIKYKDLGSHNNSTILSHAAYLMSEEGGGEIDDETLARIWMNSVSKGFYEENDLYTVYRHVNQVLEDAKEENPKYPQYKDTVKQAFDEVNISDNGEIKIQCRLNILDPYDPDAMNYVTVESKFKNPVDGLIIRKNLLIDYGYTEFTYWDKGDYTVSCEYQGRHYTGELTIDEIEGYSAHDRTKPVTLVETGSSTDVQGGTISDSWEQIIASCDNGTYKSKYKIGDTKALDLGSEGIVEMQIAAFDADELADGSGTTAITWISKQLLNSNHRMNPQMERDPEDSSKYKMGTGTVGGWEHSEMRSWLQSDIKPLIPSNVRDSIKPVLKYSFSYVYPDPFSNDILATTVDDIWIPSAGEVGYGAECDGPIYSGLYTVKGDRVKRKMDESDNSWWWLRSTYSDLGNYYGVNSKGEVVAVGSYDNKSITIGFCIGASPIQNVQGTITDSWDEIIASCENGSYKQRYKIGDTKELDLGPEGIVEMQIAAFDVDELADGSGTAAITWISKQLLKSKHRMNPSTVYDPSDSSKGKIGTGITGGWEHSEMRSWLQSDIKPLIPSNVRNVINPVFKYSRSCDIFFNRIENERTIDDVWIPSAREINDSSQTEGEGPNYSELFKSESDRIKHKSGVFYATPYWLRTVCTSGLFCDVEFKGIVNEGYNRFHDPVGVTLGFCIGASPVTNVQGTITDSWDEIIASCENGSYKQKYKIGDTKELDLGPEGIVEMQIAAFDADELADGSGTAAITWISKQSLKSIKRMNPDVEKDPLDSSKFKLGTGNIGGWSNSEIRSWLQSDIKPLFPSNVQNVIKPVTKYSSSFDDTYSYIQNEKTVDDIWIPSYREVGGTISEYETEGPVYKTLFATKSDQARHRTGVSYFTNWWCRSATYYSRTLFCGVLGESNTSSTLIGADLNSYSTYAVVIGFCI